MDSPSFKGFHAQLDCKLTYDNENQTHPTLVYCIKFRVQKQNRNDEKYNQIGITVRIHTNHDGVRATAIMVRSIMEIFGHRSEASHRNFICRPSSEKIRACSDILPDALSGRPHQSLQPSFMALSSWTIFMFPGEFGCRSFIKHSLWTVCFLLVMWKNLRVFMSHNSAEFRWTLILLSDSVL